MKYSFPNTIYKHNNFTNNHTDGLWVDDNSAHPDRFDKEESFGNILNNYYSFDLLPITILAGYGNDEVIPPKFTGIMIALRLEILRDFFNQSFSAALNRNYINIENRLYRPDSLLDIVWKVLVNGKDAQDEYDEMDNRCW